MKELFSNQSVNGGRQVELDLAKYLSLFFMILVHCFMVSSLFANDFSIPVRRGIGQLAGGPFSAPVFMFAMGVGMVYSGNHFPAYLIRRGIKLMLLGLVVNIGEFFLPHFLADNLLGKGDLFPIAGGLLLFCVDILAFAGLALILTGLLKKLNLSSGQVAAMAFVLSAIGSLVRFHDFGNDVINLTAGYLIGSAGGFTAFPLFNWFLFPAVGMLCGEYYIRCNDKKKLLCLWPLGLAVSTAYFVISWFIPGGFLSEIHHYYFLTTIDALFCLMCIYGIIGLCYSVSLFLSDPARRFISRVSKNLNAIYVIQWFLIPLTYILICYFFRDVVFGDFSLIVIALLETAASIAIASGYKHIRKADERKANKSC